MTFPAQQVISTACIMPDVDDTENVTNGLEDLVDDVAFWIAHVCRHRVLLLLLLSLWLVVMQYSGCNKM